MGYFLLWLENLSLSLLLVATLLACIGRLRQPMVRLALGTGVVFVLLLVYLGLICPAAALEFGQRPVKLGLFYPFLALTICYGFGALWLTVRARRPAEEDPQSVAAAHWPRGKLAIALAATFCLHVLTFMNIDAAVQQRMVGIRAEASALALSVAPERVADRDNAALVYEQAFEAMWPSEEWHKKWVGLLERLGALENDHNGAIDPKDPEIIKFLDTQAGALILLREASKKPACSFDRDYGRPSVDIPLPELDRMRQQMFLMGVAARHKAATGDGRGAIADVQAMFRSAQHFSAEPFLVGLLVAIALDTQACATLEEVLNAAPLSTEDLAGIDVDTAFTYRRLLDRSLRMEEAMGLWTLSTVGGLIPVRTAVAIVIVNGEPDDSPVPVPNFGLDAFYRVMLLSDDLDYYRHIMREYRPGMMQSYTMAVERWQAVENELRTNRSGILASMMLPALNRALGTVATGDARRRVAQVALALHRYRAKHGQFPEKLEDVTTEFLPVVPRDPFDDKPLRFKKTGDGWVVYSIGRDLVDNGGTRVNKDDKGDVVFEIRRQKAE